MKFVEILEFLKRGKKVCRPHWSGYWVIEGNGLIMYCKDGQVIALKDTDDVLYTLENIVAEDWTLHEDAVTPTYKFIKTNTFSEALRQCKNGKGMRLSQWAEDVVIRCQRPDEQSKMTAPYLYVESRFGKVPWKETMIELFADNWELVD